MTAPECECHGEPKFWKPDARYAAGGFYVCIVKRRAQNARAQYRLRNARRERGECVRCGSRFPIGAVCWDCLDDTEVRKGALSQ